MNSPEPTSRYLVSEIFFFRSCVSQDTLTLRLYENTFQFVTCAFKCDSAYSSPLSHSAASPVSPNSPGVPGLALDDPTKRYYLHKDVEVIIDSSRVITLRSKKPAQLFEFKLLSETSELADAFIESIKDRLDYHTRKMHRLIKLYEAPQIFQVKLKAFQAAGKIRKGNYFVWLSPQVDSLIISKTDALRPISLATKFSTIVHLHTVYEYVKNFLTGKLVIRSLQGLITLHFTPLQHQQLYDFFLALQHLCLIGAHSALRQHSVYSRADLILRKLKYVARNRFSLDRDDYDDEYIPSENEQFSSGESKPIHYGSSTGLQPSSSQGSLTTPFEICVKPCLEERRQLRHNASTPNIATPHVKTTPNQPRKGNSDGTSAQSELITPDHSITYYFEDTCEDPKGEFNNSLAPHALPSYHSMASLHNFQATNSSKREMSRTQLIENSDGLSKISSKGSNQSSQRDLLTSLIQKINLPNRINAKPVKKIVSQIFVKSPIQRSETQKFLKRDRQSQSQGGLTTTQQNKENIRAVNYTSSHKSPPLSKIHRPKFTLSTIHQAKSSGREHEEEEEEKTPFNELKPQNRESKQFFYSSLDKPPLSSRRMQSVSTRIREEEINNSSCVLLESKPDMYDTNEYQTRVEFFSVAPTLQTFNSEGSLREIMHIQQDYRENSHPVSPSPPKPKLPSKSNQNASPFRFIQPVSRSRIFKANNTQRTKQGNETTYLSTAVTPINDKAKGKSGRNSHIMEFRFQSRDNDLNQDKENKSPYAISRGHSILELNMKHGKFQDMLDTEDAWHLMSNNSEKGRNPKVQSYKHTTVMMEETKAINESVNDATESDLRSELQDKYEDDEEMSHFKDTDRMFGNKQFQSTSSLNTVKPYQVNRDGLSSQVTRVLNRARDPELASLFGTTASQCKTDRQASYSLNNSLRDEPRRNRPDFMKELRPPETARNPKLKHAFTFKASQDSEQDLDQMETERKFRNKPGGFRNSHSVLENSRGSRNNLTRESLTNLHPEPTSLQKLRDLHILYKEKYLREKERMLEMQQAHMDLTNSHQYQTLRIAQLEEEVARNQTTIQRRLQVVEAKNYKLEQDLARERKKLEMEKRLRMRAQAHFDILSTRFRQVEKHLIPKNIWVRQNKSTRSCASLTRL